MVPVENQYEQACNALDAVKAGAGITNHQFVLDPFLKYLSTHETQAKDFKQWMSLNKTIIIEALEAPVVSSTKKLKLNAAPVLSQFSSILNNS